MISTILLSLLVPTFGPAQAHTAQVTGAPVVDLLTQDDPAKEFEKRFDAAGNDVAKLWDVYLWAEAYDLKRETRRVLRKIVQVDPQHRPANEALGYIFYAGRWFINERKLEEFKKEEEARIAAEKGLVRHGDEWVPAEDVPYLEKGLVRDDMGQWVAKEEYEKLKAGWVRQDLVWVAPEEAENIEKGLWKCGDKWLSTAEADEYHSLVSQWWSIPTDHFVLHTTCKREVADKAVHILYAAYRDLVRVVGQQPTQKPEVVLLNSQQQYSVAAAGDSILGQIETHGLSSTHYAFFADGWFDLPNKAYRGSGMAYWDASTDTGNSYGPHALRHAVAHSFLEAVDPSPKTIEKTFKSRGQFDVRGFYDEKRFPEWFRYGVASYVERYYIDSTVAVGGNPNWVREWSVQNIVNKGGLRPISQIFTMQMSVDNAPETAKLLNERGLLVAFMLDGGLQPLTEAHAELKSKIRKGEDLKPTFTKIQKLIVDNEQALRKFANL